MTAVKVLALGALGITVANTVFAAVATIIWPFRYPAWVARTTSVTFLLGLAVLAVAASLWVTRR